MGRKTGVTIAGRIPVALFIFAVPLFLVTNSVTWAVNDLRLYRYGFDKYDVSTVTGIEKEGLVTAARQIRSYFNSADEPLDIRSRILGEERPLFNQREVAHMRDVKRLIWGVYGVDVAAAMYLMGFVGFGFLMRRRLVAPVLSRYVMWGSGLTIVLVVLVGLIALVGFDSLFRFFHQVSFANDFWQLDPRRDRLVMMFPQGFWLRATLFVALATVGQAMALVGIVWGLRAIRRRQGRGGPESLLQHPPNVAGI